MRSRRLSPGTTLVLAALLVMPGGTASAATPVTETGRVLVVQGDGDHAASVPHQHKRRYFLHDDAGGRSELFLDAVEERALGGWLNIDGGRFTVSGARRASNGIDVTSVRRAAASRTGTAVATPDVGSTGSIRFAMLMCRFSDSVGAPPRNRAWFQALMGGTEPAMDHYWRAQSYGRIDLTGSTVGNGSAGDGWYELPGPRSDYVQEGQDADLAKLLEDCTGASDAAGFDFSTVAGVNMAFDQALDGSAWGGGDTLALDGPSRPIGAVWIGADHLTSQNFWAHEMGHAFGMPHSGTSYDNQWDSMSGGGDTCMLNFEPNYKCVAPFTIAWHRDLPAHTNPLQTKLGTEWIPATRKYTATRARQDVRLGFADTLAGTDPVMLRLPIASGTGYQVFYTVEARRKVSYDRALPGSGVLIHRVDTRNGDSNDPGSSWTVGKTFTDTANGYTVAVTGATTTGYTIVINANAAPDTTAPSVVAPVQNVPLTNLPADNALVPVRLDWSATDGGSGVARYELRQSINGAAFTAVPLATATTRTITRNLRRASTYQFQVRAYDRAGNVSAFATATRFIPRAYQETSVTFSGRPTFPVTASTWTVDSNVAYSEGAVKYTGDAGQRATFRFTGRNIAFVTTRYAQAGRAEIWLDGTKVATVDLYSASDSLRKLVYSRAVTPGVTHTIEVRVTGTRNASATDTLIDVDAFVVLQ